MAQRRLKQNFNEVQAILDAVGQKVDKIEGKGLSANDYTDQDKNKLASVEEDAQENVIEVIESDGVELPIENKTVRIPAHKQSDWSQNDSSGKDYIKNRTHWEENGVVHKLHPKFLDMDASPTSGSTKPVMSGGVKEALDGKQDVISDLADIRQGAGLGETAYQKPSAGIPASDLAAGVIPDVSGFITRTVNDLANYYLKSETYTKEEVAALIGAIKQFHYEVYAALPATGEGNVLYLIGPTGSGSDKYEEYVYANNGWVKIGDTSIDLSGYVTIEALNQALSGYVTSADFTTLLAAKVNEEDLDFNADDKLQLADRVYNTSTPDGLGYVILRKNKTFAQQVTATNTIYEIRYDFDIGGASVTIPAGCVLKFNGGKVSNGTLSGNPFHVVADNDVSILRGITFNSSYILNETIFADWFDFVSDGVTDNRSAFERFYKMINGKGGGNIVFGFKKTYATSTILSHTTNVYMSDSLCAFNFKSCKIDIDLNQSTLKLLPSNTAICCILRLENCVGRLHNGNILGDRQNHDFSEYTNYAGNPSTDFEWCYGCVQVGGDMEFDHLNISYCVGDCLAVGSNRVSGSLAYSGKYHIHDCEISYAGRNGITAWSSYGLCTIENCYIHHIGAYNSLPGFNPQAGIDFEYEDGQGNKPDLYLLNNKFVDCSRRGISIASNSAMSSFVCENCTFIRAILNLSSMVVDGNALLDNCYVEDSDTTEQLERRHYLARLYLVMRGCTFKNLYKIAVWCKEMVDCKISTTSDSTLIPTDSTSFPQGSTDANFPVCSNCVFEFNTGFVSTSFQDRIIGCKFVYGENVSTNAARMASVTFTDCTFISNRATLGRINTNVGNGDVNFIGCTINWAGSYNYNIAGYGSGNSVYFKNCSLKSTHISHRVGNVIADNCSFEECTLGSESGGTDKLTYFKKCTFLNCGGTSQKEQHFMNCTIVSDREIAKTSVFGINGTSARGKHYFEKCVIRARNFTTPTSDTYSTYDDCLLDIADAKLTHAVIRDSVVKSSVANAAETFLNSIYYLNGVVTPARAGATADRPSLAAGDAGFQYYDSGLTKMILWNGSAWVNMDGTALNP